MRSLLLLALAVSAYGDTALRCGNLLDVAGGKLIPDAIVVIKGDRIFQAGPAASVTAPAGATIVDLSAASCMPGLIDAHDHLTSDAAVHGYQSLGISNPRSA